jgi:hypothetical protein
MKNPTHEDKIDQLFSEAFNANHPAILDWVGIKFELKALRAGLAEKEKQVENLNNIIKRGCEDEDSQCPQLQRAEKLDAENAELRNRLKLVEYQKYEFCKDVECTALEYNACNAYVCYKTAKHFHKWLKQHGYKIVKVASIV